MTDPGARIRIKESTAGHGPLPSEYEGTFVAERSGDDGTWIELKDCSPGAPQRLARRDSCEVVELVRESPPGEGQSG
jgi:hypothetical protein